VASVNARYTFSGDVLRTRCNETTLLDIQNIFDPTRMAFRFRPFFSVVAAPL
jgi:hypothetical protein